MTTITNVPSLASLEQLTTLKEINEMLARISRRRGELADELDAFVSTSSQIESKVRKAEQLPSIVHPVLEETQKLATKVSVTSNLAETVSGKVRALDRNRERLSETTKKVEDIIDVKNCIDGVATAMEESDFETAAAHIHRFLNLDESVLDSKSTELLRAAEQRLKSVVRLNLTAALSSKDQKSVIRFCKLHVPLRIVNDGIATYANHICEQLRNFSNELLKSLDSAAKTTTAAATTTTQQLTDSTSSLPPPTTCVDAITRLFEHVAQIIEDEKPLIIDSFGTEALPSFVRALQVESDTGGVALLNRFANDFQIAKTVSALSKTRPTDPDPRIDVTHLGLLLDELCALSNSCETFDRYLRAKAKSFIELVSTTTSSSITTLTATTTNDGLMHISQLNIRSQELMSGYVTLEHCFMRLSMTRAIALFDAAKQPASSSSSSSTSNASQSNQLSNALRELVDLTFFVAHKCTSRALSSGNASCVCAIVNLVNASLSVDLLARLRPRDPSAALLSRLASTFTAEGIVDLGSLNALAMASRHARQLRLEMAAQARVHLQTGRHADNSDSHRTTNKSGGEVTFDSSLALLGTCLNELDATASLFDKELNQHMATSGSAMAARLQPLFDRFAALNHAGVKQLDDITKNWAADVADSLRSMLSPIQAALEESTFDGFLRCFVDALLGALEHQILQKQFDYIGAAQLDSDLRVLLACVQALTSRSLRDKFVRLTQIANVLNLEKPSEIMDYWGDNSSHMAWRLTPAEVRRVMTLRVDFDRQAITALKL